MNINHFYCYLIPSIAKVLLGIFVIVPVTTYYLDPSDFGAFAIISAITNIFLTMFNVGGNWTLGSNYFKLSESERGELVFSVLVIELFLRLTLVGILWLTGNTLLPLVIGGVSESYYIFFKVFLVSLLVNVFWPTISYLMIIEKRARLHASIEILQTLVSTGSTLILLIYFDLRGIVLFVVPLITGFISLFLELNYVRKKIYLSLRMRWISEIWKVGAPSILANTAEAVSNSADRFFIQKWASISVLGIYSHSQTYGNILKFINKSFFRTINPELLKDFSLGLNTDSLKNQIRIWASILTGGGALIILFSHEFLTILTHGKFVEAAPLIAVWFFLICSHTLGVPSFQYLMSRQAIGSISLLQVGISFISVIACATATLLFGIIGAAISVLVSNICLQFCYIHLAQKLGCAYKDHFVLLTHFVLLALWGIWHNLIQVSLGVRVFEACIIAGGSILYFLVGIRHLKSLVKIVR